jgi:hypothetical protein
MESSLTLGVYRRLDNRFEGLPDDSPRGLELHERRKRALHDVFGDQKGIAVLSWGDTDDTKSHEWVQLVIGLVGMPVFHYAIVPGLRFVGEKLAEKAVDETTSELVKAVVSWFRPKQEEKKILDFSITLPDKTLITVDPPDRNATIHIQFADGKVESITYSQTSQPLAPTA